MDISGDVTDARRTDGRTREDRATQPMDYWKAESRNLHMFDAVGDRTDCGLNEKVESVV